jgi:hypothetical protein
MRYTEIGRLSRASYGAAVRRADKDDQMNMNTVSFAGLLLELANGDIDAALKMADRDGSFFERVTLWLNIAKSEAEDAKRIAGYGNVVRLSARK